MAAAGAKAFRRPGQRVLATLSADSPQKAAARDQNLVFDVFMGGGARQDRKDQGIHLLLDSYLCLDPTARVTARSIHRKFLTYSIP